MVASLKDLLCSYIFVGHPFSEAISKDLKVKIACLCIDWAPGGSRLFLPLFGSALIHACSVSHVPQFALLHCHIMQPFCCLKQNKPKQKVLYRIILFGIFLLYFYIPNFIIKKCLNICSLGSSLVVFMRDLDIWGIFNF